MSSLLAYLRTRRREKFNPKASQKAPDIQVDTTEPQTLPAVPPTPEFELDSKIHPDINALLASIEEDPYAPYADGSRAILQALKPSRPRVKAEEIKRNIDDGNRHSRDGYDDAGTEEKPVGRSTTKSEVPPLYIRDPQAAWSTFGREGLRIFPNLRAIGRSKRGRRDQSEGTDGGVSGRSKESNERSSSNGGSRPSTSHVNSIRTTSTISRPPLPPLPNTGISSGPQGITIPISETPSRRSSSHVIRNADAQQSDTNVLSWSPPTEPDELPSPDNSVLSRSAVQTPAHPAVAVQVNTFDSPSPRTFGHPTPLQPSPSLPPPLPFPAFHSTPKTPVRPLLSSVANDSSEVSRSRISNSSALTPFSTFGRAFRTQSEKAKAPHTFMGATKEKSAEQKPRYRTRVSSSARGHRRRESAEWRARSASAGVVSSSSQDFGWPADVSREIIRLSLGSEVVAPAQGNAERIREDSDLAGLQYTTRHRTLSAPTRRLHNHDYSGSHDLLTGSSRLLGPYAHRSSEQGPGSSHSLFLLSSPASSAASSSPRNGGASVIPQPSQTGFSKNLTPQRSLKDLKGKSRLLDDNGSAAVDSDVQTAGGYSKERMIQHIRTPSENQVKWESSQVQDFLAVGYEDGHALRPSTPIKQSESSSTYLTAGSSSLLQPPSVSVQSPTPQGSPGRSRKESGLSVGNGLGLQVPISDISTPEKSEKSQGKRKADDSEDGSPPGSKGSRKTSFAMPEGRGPHRVSNSSHAPSSFYSQKSRKRVRLSSPMITPDHSRAGSSTNVPAFGSISSKASSRSNVFSQSQSQNIMQSHSSPPRPMSRASRAKSVSVTSAVASGGRMPKRRSMSQSSIPLSAIITPHAPSIDRRSSYYMRDPRKLPKRTVGWTLRLRSADDEGSPIQAWAFWLGFFLPVLWWIASFWHVPQTRMVGTDPEKAIPMDDPHIERDARTWRLRCRIASALFFVTYAPVIILLAIFVPRS